MKRLLDHTQRRHLLAILRLFFEERRTMLLIGVFLAALTTLAGITLLGSSGWFITATALAGVSAASALSFDVFAPAAAIRFLALMRTASRYGERLTTHDATLSILAALREKLFRGWAEPLAAKALLKRPATLLFRLTVDTDSLDSLYLRLLVPAGAALVTVSVCGIVLSALVSPLLGLGLMLWLLLIGLGAPFIASATAQKTARRRAYGLEILRARTIDLVSGQTELAFTGQLVAQTKAIMTVDHYLAKADNSFNRIETATVAAFAVASAIALSATLLTVGALVEAQIISAPIAALALLVALSAMEPFNGLRRGALELGRTILAARRLAPRLSISPQTTTFSRPEDTNLALEMANVTGGHDNTSHLFNNFSLKIRKGERVAIIGSSGSGKSTLLGMITGEVPVRAGAISHISQTLLPQKTELFRDTIRENLKLGAPSADDTTLWQTLDAVGLSDVVKALPLQLSTMLGEGGLGLSGGQARRLVLARMLLRNSPFWLFDEPTESLDSDTANDVLARIEAMASSKTILITTHIHREARLADRIIVLKQGQIIADTVKTDAMFSKILETLKKS